MTREEIEEEASERPMRRRDSSVVGKWLYDNAIKALMTVAIGAWGLAFAAWAVNVKEAKTAYVDGQAQLTSAIRNASEQQQDMRERLGIVKDRQDRVIILLDDLERRVRVLENGGPR